MRDSWLARPRDRRPSVSFRPSPTWARARTVAGPAFAPWNPADYFASLCGVAILLVSLPPCSAIATGVRARGHPRATRQGGGRRSGAGGSSGRGGCCSALSLFACILLLGVVISSSDPGTSRSTPIVSSESGTTSFPLISSHLLRQYEFD